MVYWYEKKIEVDGSVVNKNIFLYCFDINGSVKTTTSLISDREFFDSIKGGDELKIAVLPGETIPVITVGAPTTAGNVTAIVNILFSKFEEYNGDLEMEACKAFLDKFSQILAKQLNNEKAAQIILMTSKLQYVWEHTGALSDAFVIDVSDYDSDLRANTIAALEQNNAKYVKAVTSVKAADNYTFFQESCTDKFFLEIPTRQELQNADNVYDLVPQFDEVCKPYRDVVAYTTEYKNVLYGNKGLMQDIEGVRKNNTYELYDNEKEYYAALDEWVRFNMRELFGTSDGDVIDPDSQRYLMELITMFYMLHWRHCRYVPDEIDKTVDDENSDADCADRYIFNKDNKNVNAVIVLGEFLKEVAAENGYTIYLSALMQIARWGTRKPTALVFEGVEREFDLGLGIVHAKVGDISQYHTVQIDGKDCEAIGLIVEEREFRDKQIKCRAGLPVGVLTQTVMKNERGDELKLLDYYHFVDLIPMIQKGKLNIAGIAYDNGEWSIGDFTENTFTVNELINLYEKNKNSLLRFPFYRSEEVVNLFTRTSRNSTGMLPNLFSIMNARAADPLLGKHIEEAKFVSYDDVLAIIANQQNSLNSTMSVIEYSIVGALLPVYERLSESYVNTSTVVENWCEALKVYTGLPHFSAEHKQSSDIAKAANVTSFGKVEKEVPQQAEQSSSVQSKPEINAEGSTTWFKVVPQGVKVYRVITPQGDNVGYVYLEKVAQPGAVGRQYTCYTLLEDAEGCTVDEERTINVYTILACVFHTIHLRETAAQIRQVYFKNDAALIAWRNKLNSIAKEGQ